MARQNTIHKPELASAIYYFNYAELCLKNKLDYLAEIYFEDSWTLLFNAAINGELD